MAARLRIAAVGEVGLDRFVDRGVETLGGCSCNLARAAAAEGADAALFAPVGDDPRGAEVRGRLAATALHLRVRTEPGVTALQRIRSEPDGERRFCGWEPGVVASYQLTPDERAELATYDVIAIGDTPAWEQCLALAGPRRTADFSQDAGTPWRFTGLDIAFVGGTPADLERLRPRASPATLLVLTAGAAGAWAITPERVVHQPTLATAIVDTTGCGDAFQGAFAVARFSGASLEQSLRAAAQAAARAAGRLGA